MSEPNSMDTEMTTATDHTEEGAGDKASDKAGASQSQVEESTAPAAKEEVVDVDQVETPASDDTVTDEAVTDEVAAGDDVTGDDGTEEEDSADEPEPVATRVGPIEIDEPEEEDIHLEWYILKVQSNRERSISEALRRKIAIEGLDDYFGEVLVPTEKVTEFKGGKKKVVQRKLWPGYIAVQMHVNDDTWFAIRETSGIGDFTGSGGSPTPMEPAEVAMILHKDEEETDEAPKLDIKFSSGDKVKVTDGNFESFEGEVSSIDETHGRVTVMLSIFGRPTPVELEYWQIEAV